MRRVTVLVSLIVVLLLAAIVPILGCGSSGNAGKTGEVTAEEVKGSFTDDLGRTIKIDATPQRIVSISPANTEILFALGLGKKVVGVTEYCTYPKAAASKPKIGSFETPNIEAIVNADPDLVLATGGLQKEMLDEMERLGLNVYAVYPKTFSETIATIKDIGKITGTSARAVEITDDMRDRAKVIEKKVAAEGVPRAKRPKVFYEIFFENGAWTAGSESVISDLIRIAGGNNIGDVDASDYFELSVEKLVAENPDIYIVGSGSMAKPGDVETRSGFEQIKAVQDGRIFVIDEDLVYRTGPRLIDGLEKIYECIYPDKQ